MAPSRMISHTLNARVKFRAWGAHTQHRNSRSDNPKSNKGAEGRGRGAGGGGKCIVDDPFHTQQHTLHTQHIHHHHTLRHATPRHPTLPKAPNKVLAPFRVPAGSHCRSMAWIRGSRTLVSGRDASTSTTRFLTP